MDLLGFSSLFQFFAVFNLAFSNSENFSVIINSIISNSLKDFRSIAENRIYRDYIELSNLAITHDSTIDTKNIKDKAKEKFEKYSSQIKELNKNHITDVEYGEKFKTLYLLVGLFNLYILFLAGIRNECVNELYKFNHSLLLFNTECLLFCLFVFLMSFKKSYKRIRHFATIIIFILMVFFSFMAYKKCDLYNPMLHLDITETFNCKFSLLLSFTPFVLHFLGFQLNNLFTSIKIGFKLIGYGVDISQEKTALQELDKAKKLLQQHAKK